MSAVRRELPFKRAIVLGTSGAGKTTFSQALAQTLRVPCVELDALHWLPGWREAPLEDFRQRVLAATAGDAWVVDGNYGKVRDLVWRRAQAAVWLDYSLPRVLWQAIGRTLRRSLSRELLWGTNREDLGKALLSRDSIVLWVATTFARRRRQLPRLLAASAQRHLRVFRLRTPRDAGTLLAHVRKGHPSDLRN